jgi:hypothetical protein
MQGTAWIFFIITAVILLTTYLAIRRSWASPGLTAAVSVVATIICMILTALAQGNSSIQAVVVGILVGSIFSGATVGMAWYFQSHEQAPSDELYTPQDEASS